MVYEYKVGDIGKTNDGKGYIIKAIWDAKKNEYSMVVKLDYHHQLYFKNGCIYPNGVSELDLNPPGGH